MICKQTVEKYCSDDVSKIENYSLAITDMDNTWDCHHRLEIGKNGERISRDQLKEYGLYYGRPSSELIFLTHSEHIRIHKIGNKNGLGKKLPPRSEEHCRKISEGRKGDKNPMFGKHPSEETRMKMSLARKAYLAKKKMAGK